MGNKDMRSEINQVHQIFATLMGFIGAILAFLIKSLTQNNVTIDSIKLVVYLTTFVSFIILVAIVLHIWVNKVITIINNYKTNVTETNLLDILLPLGVINIIISITSIVLAYFSLNILLSPRSSDGQSLLLSLSVLLVLFSFSPIAITIYFIKRYKNQMNRIFEKYYKGFSFWCHIICTFNAEIFIVTFVYTFLNNPPNHIFNIFIFILAFTSIIFNLIILFILLHEISSSENNTVRQNSNKGEPKNPTTNSDSTSSSENKASSSKITTKNNSKINLIHSGIAIASLIALVLAVLIKSHSNK